FHREPDPPQGIFMTPVWSPDNSLIAFSNPSGGRTDIYTVKSDGSDLKRLTDDPIPSTDPAFSRDGKEIFFARDSYGNNAYLYRTDLDGSNQRRVTGKDGYELSPEVSPDGSTLAFTGDRREGTGLDIFLLDLSDPSREKDLVSLRS